MYTPFDPSAPRLALYAGLGSPKRLVEEYNAALNKSLAERKAITDFHTKSHDGVLIRLKAEREEALKKAQALKPKSNQPIAEQPIAQVLVDIEEWVRNFNWRGLKANALTAIWKEGTPNEIGIYFASFKCAAFLRLWNGKNWSREWVQHASTNVALERASQPATIENKIYWLPNCF